MSNPSMTDLTTLRKELKRRRRQLSEHERLAAANAAIGHVVRHPRYRSARRIAAFVGSHGELDPLPLLNHAAAHGKTCYLPVLHPFQSGRLWFCRWQPGEPMRVNRFGITEPLPHWKRIIPPRNLDLVLIPLLGFDDACHRLGMGAGFYDRTLAFVLRTHHARRPFLLGFAHATQRVPSLINRPWDVPLDAIATDQGILASCA